jgi:hypothetical protein
MKRLILFFTALLLAAAVYATDANQLSYVALLPTVTNSVTGSAVDIAVYKGNAAMVVNWSASGDSSYTGTVTLTHSTASGGTYTTVTNTAGTAGVLTSTGTNSGSVATFPIDLGRLHKYVKVVAAQVNVSNAVGVVLAAPMKSQ